MLGFLRFAISLAFGLALCALFFLLSPRLFAQALALGLALRLFANALRLAFRLQAGALFRFSLLVYEALGFALLAELLAFFLLELLRFGRLASLLLLFFGFLREEQLLFALRLLLLEQKLLGAGLLGLCSFARCLLARSEGRLSLFFAGLIRLLTFALSLLLLLGTLPPLSSLHPGALERLGPGLLLLLRGEPCSLLLLPLFGRRPLLLGLDLLALLLCRFALFQCQLPTPLAVLASFALLFLEFFLSFACFALALFLEQ